MSRWRREVRCEEEIGVFVSSITRSWWWELGMHTALQSGRSAIDRYVRYGIQQGSIQGTLLLVVVTFICLAVSFWFILKTRTLPHSAGQGFGKLDENPQGPISGRLCVKNKWTFRETRCRHPLSLHSSFSRLHCTFLKISIPFVWS